MKCLFRAKCKTRRNVTEPLTVILNNNHDYPFWKWKPYYITSKINEVSKENSISFKSRLVVMPGEVVIFIYKDTVGMHDLVQGPHDKVINESDFPVLAALEGSAFGTGAHFQADVYFVNLSSSMKISLGTHYFTIYDRFLPQRVIPCGIKSAIEFSITDYMRFVELYHSKTHGDPVELKNKLDNYLTLRAKDEILNIISTNNFDISHLDEKLETINNLLDERFTPSLLEEFGITLKHYEVISIEIERM